MIIDAPKSTSRNTVSFGQLRPLRLRPQPLRKMSFSVAWNVHFSEPSFRSIARIASVVGAAGSEVASPVPTYSTPRFASIAGDVQIGAPDGPHSILPSPRSRTGFASSIVCAVQIVLPVRASSAFTAP